MDIKNVVVIGASGAVGKAVSGIFASFGNATVYMVCRNPNKNKEAPTEAALSVKALTVKDNLILKSMDELEECVSNADLVFESVSENINLKKEIHSRVNKSARESCIVATGTSGLSIDELAECYDKNKKKNFLGIHFFNPPYNLLLCELIPSKYNDKNIVNKVRDYLTDKLLRDVVIVKNEPAFLANRIGFMFMNEALQYAEKYKEYGGIDYIDFVLGKYTGRNMKPIETIDFVGLDVHKAIVDNVYKNTDDKDSFKLPDYVNTLIDEGKLGAKVKEGIYKKENGKNLVYDIAEGTYREIINYNFYYLDNVINCFKIGKYKEGFDIIKNDNSQECNICMYFMLKYIVYSIETAKKLCDDVSACDSAMASGFNWLPPLALIEVLGGTKEVVALCKKHLKKDYSNLFINIPKSKFDYRKYIKAKV